MTEHGLPVEVAARVPGFLLRIGVGFLHMQRRRKSGVREFRDILVEGGIPPLYAERLAEVYHNAGSPRRLLGRFAPPSPDEDRGDS